MMYCNLPMLYSSCLGMGLLQIYSMLIVSSRDRPNHSCWNNCNIRSGTYEEVSGWRGVVGTDSGNKYPVSKKTIRDTLRPGYMISKTPYKSQNTP